MPNHWRGSVQAIVFFVKFGYFHALWAIVKRLISQTVHELMIEYSFTVGFNLTTPGVPNFANATTADRTKLWNVKWVTDWIIILTRWGRVTHTCVSRLNVIGSDNGLSPGWFQAIIWTNIGILLIGPLGKQFQWNLNRNLHIFIQKNAFENVVWKMSAILSRPQCVNTSQQPMSYKMWMLSSYIVCKTCLGYSSTNNISSTFTNSVLLWYNNFSSDLYKLLNICRILWRLVGCYKSRSDREFPSQFLLWLKIR